MPSSRDALLLYDGVCGLCDKFVRSLLRADRNKALRFAPLQGPTAAPILRRRGLSGDPLRTVVLVLGAGAPDERIFLRSDAALRAYGLLGGWRKAAAVLLALPPRALRDAAYDVIARRRTRWFGKFDACPIPPPEWRERFLP